MIRGAAVLLLLMAAAVGVRAQPAETEQVFAFQGVDRHYVLHRPPGRAGPVPLVVALHGFGGSVSALRSSWTLDSVADREGFAVLYPTALGDRWSYTPARSVPLPDGRGTVDDVGFVNGLVDRLAADIPVDPSRVYVVGVSNGGLMAFTFACGASARYAGVAAIITGMVEEQAAACHPERLVPLLAMAGTNDLDQNYDGAVGPNYRLMSVPETLEFWRRLRGCEQGLAFKVAPLQPSDPTHPVMVSWTNCRDPSPLRFWRIEGGNHSVPSFAPLSERERELLRSAYGVRSRGIEAAEELWSFFAATAPR